MACLFLLLGEQLYWNWEKHCHNIFVPHFLQEAYLRLSNIFSIQILRLFSLVIEFQKLPRLQLVATQFQKSNKLMPISAFWESTLLIRNMDSLIMTGMWSR